MSGYSGSGTIFVSGCNLRCPLCQNWQISGGSKADGKPKTLGRRVCTEEFASICLALQGRGAENVNIVTGSHAAPAIAQGLGAAKTAGLAIPALWNSSGYDGIASLELLDGCIGFWLPDLKTLDSALAGRFFNAPDYPQVAAEAIQWMILNKPGKVIVRHLVLPGYLESTHAVLRWFAEKASGGAQLSLMSQYTPIKANAQSLGPGRFLTRQEYDTVLGFLEEFGIEDGFCQDLVTGSEWLPDFRRANPFSSNLSMPIWHYAG